MESKLEQIVKSAGYEVSTARSWMDETGAYACSVKSDRACYGHPVFEVHYNAETEWLTITGRPPVKLAWEQIGRAA